MPRRAAVRLLRAWRALSSEQRVACLAAVALLATMFLPWYEKSTIPVAPRKCPEGFCHDRLSAFGAVSFVEAAVFLVSLGVLWLCFLRAERRGFHLPGGDGTVVLVAGLWATLLIFYRVFDRPGVEGRGSTVGIQWGFFFAFVAAGFLAYAGLRMRAARRPEPPLPTHEAPTERRRPSAGDEAPTAATARRTAADEAETRRMWPQ